MRILTIPGGAHRPDNRLPPVVFYWNKNSLTEDYMFTESCCYTLPGDAQYTWNKLTGLSFGFAPDRNSGRFAWRYNPYTKKIEIGYYIYYNAALTNQFITSVNISDKVSVFMYRDNGNAYFFVESGGTIEYAMVPNDFWKQGLSTRLGLYFGGSRAAPHKIEVLKFNPPYV